MGSLSDFAENKFLDHLLGTTSWTTPADVYLALWIGDPLDTGSGGAEVTGTGYIRKACAFGNPAARVIPQNATVQYDSAETDWGVVTHWALFDAATTGNMVAHGSLASSKNIVTGNTPSVASGEVSITVSAAGCSDYLANAMLNHIFNTTAFTVPSLYVALASVALLDASTGTTLVDLVMTDYAREAVTTWDAASSGASANTDLITFDVLTGTQETVEAIAICDGLTANEILVYDNTPSQLIGSGDTVQMIAGAFDISLA